MKDKIICLVGPSGSGKTTIAKELEKEGYNIIHSYTDRKPRVENEWGHTFVSKVDIPMADKVIAYKTIYGNRYYALKHQYQGKGTSIYTVCPDGAKQVQENVKDAEVITIFLACDREIRENRMRYEGREPQTIHDRIIKDFLIFHICKCDYVVDGNREIDTVVLDVIKIIEREI